MATDNVLNGIIIKGIGGFYYVETACGVIECKARGVFRKEKITPMVGDRVVITLNENGPGTIDEIKERSTKLLRPPVSNIDRLFVIVSAANPRPNTLVCDRLTAYAVKNGIEPVIVFNKTDLCSVSELAAEYEKTPFKVISACGKTGEGIELIREELKGHISAFAGNTGVGKTTLLNLIDKKLCRETNEISKKLGRGRHTTRECVLIKLSDDTYVADTPGFASFDFSKTDPIKKDELQYCFPEFEPFIGKCRFNTDCSHVKDSGCAVAAAANDGIISKTRHESYKTMYFEVKDIKDWEMK